MTRVPEIHVAPGIAPGPAGSRTGANDLFAGDGELAALMRAKDWSQTPLGPPDQWPQSLKTCVRIVLTSRQPMFIWWGGQLINLYNDAYKAIVGGKHPVALGQPAASVWREIWDQIAPRAEAAMRRNEGTYDEALLLIMERYGYQEETYYTFSYSPVPDDTGGTGGIICANTDDTQRIIGERQLALLKDLAARTGEARSAEDACRLAALALGTNPRDLPFALIYLLGPERRSLKLVGNAGIEPGHAAAPEVVELDDASAWPFGEVLRTNVACLVPDLDRRSAAYPPGAWDRPPFQAMVLPLLPSGKTGRAGVLISGLNPYRPCDQNYRDFLGLVAGQIAAASANAQAYEDERERAEALAEIDRAKTAFFSNVSHEFRTPLTLMLGPLEDVLNDPAPPALTADQRQQLDVAHRNSLRLLRLVNTLLDFSRIEAGRMQARYQPADLAALTTDLASGFRSAVERAGLFLKIDCPTLSHPVHVDREMWEKVVLNLLSNAFKYTFDGGIEISMRAEDGNAVMTVADTGVGIPRHELPRLFERFHRIEGQKSRSFEGSGIGLALVQELVRLHGGTIAAESEAGRGSAFTVTIPFGTAHLHPDEIAPATAPPLAGRQIGAFVEEALRWLPEKEQSGTDTAPAVASGPCPRVLLADDNSDMRGYVCRLLRDRYEVTAVADGQEALDAIRNQRPDLVLTDVMMPRLDGFGLLRAIRDDPALRDLPVVLLSARAGDEARAEGLDAGADDYLIKPFTARELLARLGANLAMARVRQEAAQAALDSAQRLRQMFEQAPGFMCILRGPDLVFELANEACLRLIGHRDVIGRTVREAFREIENQDFFEHLYEVCRTGRPFTGQGMRIVLRRGDTGPPDEKFVDFVFQPIHDGDGAVTSIFVEGSDVTERVHAEMASREAKEELEARVAQRTAELRQALDQLHGEVLEREQAEEALRHAQKMEAIGQLTGGIAHDFNNMLQAILGGLEIAQHRIADGRQAEAGRFLDAARQAADGAASLTRRLLAFGRRQRLEPRAVNPDELVTGMADLIRRTVGAAVEVELHLEADQAAVWCDPNGLESALLNLCINARDAMPAGGKLTLATHAQHLTAWDVVGQENALPGDYVAIAVADTGEGMLAEVLARAFEPFFTTKPQGQGTGLGLSQVFGFVRQSGGLVKLASTPGNGTAVQLYLPVHEPATEPQAVTSETSELGQTVLLVGDDDAVRGVAVGRLREQGYYVLEAADGPMALHLLDGGARVDVLVTDVGLPRGMNGRQVAEVLRERRPGLPVLFLTGRTGAALPSGIGVVGRPFDSDALVRQVQEALAAQP